MLTRRMNHTGKTKRVSVKALQTRKGISPAGYPQKGIQKNKGVGMSGLWKELGKIVNLGEMLFTFLGQINQAKRG